jgi:hypothetical protein
VNEHLAKDFFWMSRTILALPPGQSQRQQSQQAACTEKTVTLAARIAVRFISNRVTVRSFFCPFIFLGFADLC